MDFPLRTQATPGDEARRAAWRFGEQLHQGPFSHPPTPYCLDLAQHQGVIVGQTEHGMSLSLLRLAANAGQQGWKVVMFDAQSVPAQAVQFVATMQAVGRTRTYVFPHEAYRSFRAYLAGNFPWRPLMSAHGARSYGRADAIYLGFNVWSRPEEAHALAHHLLAGLTRYLAAWEQEQHRVLLLIKHPCLLFAPEQIAPLFAFCEQVHSSLFVAARSFEDLGGFAAARILENASTLLIHRGSTARHVVEYVARPRWRTHGLLNKTLRQLPDDQCLVIHHGQLSRVRVDPVVIEPPAPLHIRIPPLPPDDVVRAAWRHPINRFDGSYGLQDTHHVGSGPTHLRTELDEMPTGASSGLTRSGQVRHTRVIRIDTPEQAYLRHALALLGFSGQGI